MILNKWVFINKSIKKSFFQKIYICFEITYGQVFPKNHFFNKKKQKKTKEKIFLYLSFIMDVITNLLKSWELGLNFKNTKKH
jgi:hypothetical protein